MSDEFNPDAFEPKATTEPTPQPLGEFEPVPLAEFVNNLRDALNVVLIFDTDEPAAIEISTKRYGIDNRPELLLLCSKMMQEIVDYDPKNPPLRPAVKA